MRFLISMGFFIASYLQAQVPYTLKSHTYRVEKNITYAIDTAYDGRLDTLRLDLYKPVLDSNCHRPVVVVVHGGAWLGGDKAGGSIPAICAEFAARGYVAASVNYRLGMHPASYYVPYALCVQEKCSYVADTAEWIRAGYRAMQDVKSAIRYIKSRNHLDSSDHNNVFLLGESAGAFTAMLSGWLDSENEKPASCRAIGGAPVPDDDLSSCVISQADRSRPDLGSVRGKFHLGTWHEKVKGVAAFYGGVTDTAIFRQLDPADTPVLYMFHQTCDVIVDHETSRLFSKLYQYCYNPVNLCMPFTAAPFAWGSSAVSSHLQSAKTGIRVKYTLLAGGGNYNCSPSANCHGIDGINVRIKEVTDFFAPVIAASGNKPGLESCYFSVRDLRNTGGEFVVHPNPGSGSITIVKRFNSGEESAACILEGMDGKVVFSTQIAFENGAVSIQIPDKIPAGIYHLKLIHSQTLYSLKYILQK